MAWTLLLYKYQKFNISYPQFMQIYWRGYNLYGFDWKRVSGAKYIVKNSPVSQEYKNYDKNNMEYKDNALAKY